MIMVEMLVAELEVSKIIDIEQLEFFCMHCRWQWQSMGVSHGMNQLPSYTIASGVLMTTCLQKDFSKNIASNSTFIKSPSTPHPGNNSASINRQTHESTMV